MRLLAYRATLAVFVIAGIASIVLALVALLDPNLKGSGIVTLKVRRGTSTEKRRLSIQQGWDHRTQLRPSIIQG
jgi:hypothetical protein